MLFEVESALKRKIRLTETQWNHIRIKHPEIENQIEKIILSLIDPDLIYLQSENTYHYIKFFRETPVTQKYLLTVVKHLNKEGFVITCFFMSKIKEKGKVLVYAKDKDKLR